MEENVPGLIVANSLCVNSLARRGLLIEGVTGQAARYYQDASDQDLHIMQIRPFEDGLSDTGWMVHMMNKKLWYHVMIAK